MTGYRMDTERDVSLNIQKKTAEVLIIKRDMQTINQETDLDNFSILYLQKKLVHALKNVTRRHNEEIKRNQVLWHYLKGLKIKIVRNKRKKCKIGLLDQD